MNIIIDKEKILPALNLVSSVVEGRQTLPMLSNLYFSLKDGVLEIVGTDMEMEVSETVNEVQGDNGSFTVSTKKFLDIVRILPENSSISVKKEKDKAVVTSARSRYALKTLPADDFPRIKVDNWEERLKVSQSALRALLGKTSFAMAVQDVRYYLIGVLFELSGKQLRSIATDGHRLAQSDMDTDLDVNEPRELIIPRKAVIEINRFIGGEDADGEEDVQLTVEMNRNHLKLTKNNTILTTKLIDGKFPEYKGILDNKFDVLVSVNRLDFIGALSRVAVLTEAHQHQGIKINIEAGGMRVTATNLEQEEAEDYVDIEYSGKPMEIGYNVNYLIDAARAGHSETIELHLQGSDGICVMKQPGDDRTIWLTMPMRL